MKNLNILICVCCLALTSCEMLVMKAIDRSPLYVAPKDGKTAQIQVLDRNPVGPEKYKYWITHVDDHKTASITRGLKTVSVEAGFHTITVHYESRYRIDSPTNELEQWSPYMNSSGTRCLGQYFSPGESYVISQNGRDVFIKK